MSKVTRWANRLRHSTTETLGDLRCFASGYRHFKKRGATPAEAYTSMRRLFRKTNGRFNDAMGSLCKAIHPKRRANLAESLFENPTLGEIRHAAGEIRRNGFFAFDRKLPADLCHKLLNFSLTHPAVPKTVDASDSETDKSIFNRAAPQSVRHQFEADDLFLNETVQQIATDPFFFSIAEDYLGFNPVFDVLTMWWECSDKRPAATVTCCPTVSL